MKTIVITGGSSGIGKAIADSLKESNRVIVLSLEDSLNDNYYKCDVSDYKQVESSINDVLNKYRSIDILINNAGIWIQDELETNNFEKIKQVIDVNLLGTINVTKAVLTTMKSNKKGLIINMNSQNGLNYKSGRSVYNSSKWGLTGFTKCLQEELKEFNVRVTDINPGMVSTNLFSNANVNRDETYALDVSEVVRIVNFVIESNEYVHIPTIGVKHIRS